MLGQDSRRSGGPVLPLMGQLVLDRAGGLTHAKVWFAHDSTTRKVYWADVFVEQFCLVLINNHDGVDDPTTASRCSCCMHGRARLPTATRASSTGRAVGWPSHLAGDISPK